MNQSPPIIPAPERAPADRPTRWLSPLSVTPEVHSALLRETAESCRGSQISTPTQIAHAPVSSAEIRFSDVIASAYPSINEDGGNSPLVSTASAGERHGPISTYIGHLEVKEDALRLLEGSFRELLCRSFQRPQSISSSIRSGYIFIWEQETSGIDPWDDGISWTPIDREGDFWISRETTPGDGLLKKTISIPALGRFHHIVSYYNPWDTVNGNLKVPSEDPNLGNMTLRTDLASQLTMSPSSTKQSRLAQGILKTCSPIGHLQLMRSALLLCLCCADGYIYEYLLRRKLGDWFPHVPSNPAYWHELSSRDPFRGMKPKELKTQSRLLLFRLIEFSNGRTSSRSIQYQPSGTFSAVQNRSLCGEMFRIPYYRLWSPRPFDPAKLSTDLARSVLFDQNPKIDPMSVEKWRNGLTLLIPIYPPVHGVLATILGILDQVAIEECETFRMISMVHCNQFPCFMQAKNHLPLFLVVCQSIPVGRKFTELLHNWSISTDGIKTYHCLLKTTQDALPSDELMLSLSALVALHSIMRGTESDDTESPEPVQLVDVHRLLTGENAISVNQAILRDMVWSFFRAVTQVLSPDAYPHCIRFLDPALAAVSTSEQNPERILDHYWMKRLLTPSSHVDAMAEVWKDVQSVPTPVGPSVKYAEKEEGLSIIVDGKAGDETSNYSTPSTQVDKIPLAKQTEDRCSIQNPGHHTSMPWWLTF